MPLQNGRLPPKTGGLTGLIKWPVIENQKVVDRYIVAGNMMFRSLLLFAVAV